MRPWPATLALLMTLTACWTQNPAPYVSTDSKGDIPPHLYQASPARVYGHVLRLAQDKPEWQLLTDVKAGEGYLATFYIDTHPIQGHDEVRFIVTPDSYGVSSVAMTSRTRERSQDFRANNRRVRSFFQELDATLPIATGSVAPPPKVQDDLTLEEYADFVPVEPYKSPDKPIIPGDAPNQDTAQQVEGLRMNDVTP